MANQITIDIGAAANDGTGDPLRTAFNYVNNNFSNVWNTGLPNSNVQFSDNRILTVNTNANLVLAPNGVGKVASNVDIVPNTANVFALGSSTRRWNTVYGQYLDLSHNAVIGGNLVVTGNLSAGNISYTSNVFVGDLEGSVFDGASSIVLDVIDSAIYVDNYYYANGTPVTFGGGNGTPGGSNTQIQYNNAGSFGGSAAFTFDRTSNVLSVSGNISAGNIGITNLTSSNTVSARTATFTGDQYSDGAIYVGTPVGTVLGSDVVMQITANAGGYSQTNFQNINSGATASSDYILTADNGNDTTHFMDMGITSSGWDGSETNVLSGLVANNGYLYVQDGNLSLGVRNGNTSYRWNFDTTGLLTVPGNIIPTGNNTQSLGSATRQWNDLYLSNATIYMNSVPISLTAGNVLTVNGADVVTTNSSGQANIGNLDITGTYVSIASGAAETIITISPNIEGQAYLQIPDDATANAANVRLHNDAGNIELGTGSGSHLWYFDNTGNLSVPVNINFNGGGLQQVVNEDFYIRASDNEADGWSIYNVVDDGAGNTLTQTRLAYNDFTVRTDAQGASYTWAFRDSGVLDLPGDIYGNVGGNLTIKIGDQAGSNTFIDLQTRSYVGDALISNIRIANPNVTISTASGAQNWTFGSTGTLTFPGLANISGGNFNAGTASATVALNAFSPDGNTVSIQAQGNTSSAVISIFANSGPVTNNWTFTQAPLDPTEAFLYVPPGASISTPNATGGEGGKNIFIQAGASDPVTWNSNPGGELMLKGGYGSFGDGGGGPGGNVNISGGESSDSHAGNVNIASGLNTWVFDYSGVLTAPGNIISNIVSATNNDGTGRNIKVGDDTWLGDINISNTLSLRGQQDGTSGYIVFGNASNVKLGRVGTGPLRYEGDFEANGNITAGNNFQLPVYANTTVRDSSIASPSPGMMIYVTGTGMQVRGATSWNTIAGSGT